MKCERLYSKPVFMSLCVILLFVFVPESFSQITPLSGRTPQVRDAIVAAVGKSEGEITAEDLSEITNLSLTSKGIASLKSVDFDNLPNLHNLVLNNNNLTTLPSGIFSTNHKLAGIFLNNNELTSLPAGLFKNTALNTVWLNDNALTSLPHDIFENCEWTIRLQNNMLTEIPESIENLTTLDALSYAGNPIENSWSIHTLVANNSDVELDAEPPPPPPLYGRTPQIINAIAGMVNKKPKYVTEADLVSIDHVAVSDSNISSLQPHDFHGLTGVISIYLNRNSISSLPTDVFRDLTSLENLHLKDNSIGDLPPGVFQNTSKLAWLDLTGNNISTLSRNTFANTPKMEMLQLADNNISSLPSGIFNNMPYLWWLELAMNNISSLPSGIFDNNPEVVYIDLGHNDLTSLPTNVFSNNTDLFEVALDGNSIDNLDEIIKASSLSSLRISGNSIIDYDSARRLKASNPDLHLDIEIPEISEVLSGRTQAVQSAIVKEVGKSDDQITSEDLKRVEWMSVSNQHMSYLKLKDFQGLTNLRQLYLENCGINRLEKGQLDDLVNLETLSLQKNNIGIRGLPDGIFDKNTKLRNLDLSHNRLFGNDLPADIFENNVSLYFLYLNNNRLQSLPKTLFDNTGLKILDVRNNELSRIDCILNETTLTHLYINGNRLYNAYAIYKRKEANPDFYVDYTDLEKKLPIGRYALLGRTPQVQKVLLDRINSKGRIWDISDVDPLLVGSIRTTAQNPLDFGNLSLTTLKPNDFQWLWYVKHLNIHSNQLKTLPAGVFDELKALAVLNLSGNRITSLDANIFAKNKELTWLVLANNQLTTIPLTIFDSNKKMTLVSLHSNNISKATQQQIVNKYIDRINFIF